MAGHTLKMVLADLVHHPQHHIGAVFCDEFLAASSVAKHHAEAPNYEVKSSDTWQYPNGNYVWLDGEAFDESGPLEQADLAARLCSEKPFRLDGSFVAVIYDSLKQRLRFISDPYGLKYLYVRVEGGLPAWSSELAAFKLIPGPAPEINENCLNQFLEYGYPLGTTTWFRGVHLLEAGACWEYSSESGTWSLQRYEQVENQKPATIIPDWSDAVLEAGRLFRRAVAKRSHGGKLSRIGLTLSGGLDSRALLAALPEQVDEVQTLTFGLPGCADAVLAQKACKIRRAHNTFIRLGMDGWLQARAQHIARTDGQFSILHMHGMESLGKLESLMDVCLHGFLGDALPGGSYLAGPGFPFLTRYMHRGRRFILQALHHSGTSLHFRLPFMDLAFLDLILRLPREWLIGSKFYRAMLLHEFPDYFQNLPWEKTGLPISASTKQEKLYGFKNRVLNKGRHLLGLSIPSYTDYPNWLRERSAEEFLKSQLLSSNSLLKTRLSGTRLQDDISGHFRGKDNSEMLGRYLTMEIWLRYLSNL